MRKFDVKFEVHQKFVYKMSIEAETPEEALKIIQDDEFDTYEAEEDLLLESWDDRSTAVVYGERISSPDGSLIHKPFDK